MSTIVISRRGVPQTVQAPVESAATRLRLTSRGRRVLGSLIAVPLAVLLGVMGLWGVAASAGDQAPAGLSYVTVYSGDTLWSIAERVATGVDTREVVEEIRSINGLSSSALVPGQRIAVPSE